MLRAAVDVGGTFSDVCILDEATGGLQIAKVPTTLDPIDGVIAGLAAAGADLHDVAFFAHGTTVATNALITRNLPLAAMVTTRGFRDIIEIRRGTKEDLWDTYKDSAVPYIRRRDRYVVSERIDYEGSVLEVLDEGEARAVAAILKRKGVAAVAVCFVNAHANPENEVRMREILEEELPGVEISASAEVLPEVFEHERFSTTVVNAILAPLIGGYASRLAQRMEDGGYAGDVLLLHSGGGVMTAATAQRFAGRMAASGIAAGAIAANHIAESCGFHNAIALDMGGTSTDVSLIVDNQIKVTNDWHVEYGYPIRFPTLDVLTIGAGGGSIGWIDEGGSLRNGPQSAGAIPGPACYGLGGELPTNTDANLLLGRIPEKLVGGAMTLDATAAARAIENHLAIPLGLSVPEAALAMLRVAEANMADAVRVVSIRRGHDPRDFVLVGFGGAGPLHAAQLARDLEIPTAIIPPSPGVTSALGCLLVDVRHDLFSMLVGDAATLDPALVDERFRELAAEARSRLEAERIAESDQSIICSIDMRYVGQWRSITIPVGSPPVALAAAVEAFHQEHKREHDYSTPDAPVEVYRLNVTAIGKVPPVTLPRQDRVPLTPQARASREVVVEAGGLPVETPVFERQDLAPGVSIDGPAVIDQIDSTVMIPPGVKAEVDEWFNIVLTV